MIGKQTFAYTGLEEFSLPESVLEVGDGAFQGCSNLKQFLFNNEINTIPANMFNGCYALISVSATDNDGELILPKQIESIGKYAFNNTGFKKAIVSEKIKEIEECTFANCQYLAIIEFEGDGAEKIGSNAFYMSGLENVKLPASLNEIGSSAFEGCGKLQDITVGDNITNIHNRAFMNCSMLTTLNPRNEEGVFDLQNISSLGSYAFYNTGLKKVVVPQKMSSLPEYSFAECKRLNEIVLHQNYVGISYNHEFENCYNLLLIRSAAMYAPHIKIYCKHNKMEFSLYPLAVIPSNTSSLYKDFKNPNSSYFDGSPYVELVESDNPLTDENYFADENFVYKKLDNERVEAIRCRTVGEPLKFASIVRNQGKDYRVAGTASSLCEMTCFDGNAFDTNLPEFMEYCTLSGYLTGYSYTDFNYNPRVKILGDLPSTLKRFQFSEGIEFDEISIPECIDTLNASISLSSIKKLTFKPTLKYINPYSFSGNIINVLDFGMSEVEERSVYKGIEDCDVKCILVEENNPKYIVSEDGLSLFTKDMESLVYFIVNTNKCDVKIPFGVKKVMCGFDSWRYSVNSVTLPATIDSIFVVSEKTIATVHCHAKKLPNFAEGLVWKGTTLYVPRGCKSLYESSKNWQFTQIIEEDADVPSFNVTYIVDGVVFAVEAIEYGSVINLIEEPEKEGHTFSGWSEIPETMPAHDVTVTGSFTVNKYMARYYDGETLLAEFEVEYGAAIPQYEYNNEEFVFEGWEGEKYETMPAHDIAFYAITTPNGIEAIQINDIDEITVFDMNGLNVYKGKKAGMPKHLKGLYIIKYGDKTIKCRL